jgi:glycosyltransferase involved in cell wall biosynthesis
VAERTDTPLVSVVVRTKDRQEELLEALASIVAQSHRPLEVVVVNDGGGPVDRAVQTADRAVPVTLVHHPTSRGRAAAANAGVAAAKGEWIAFLDDDDLFLPGHLTAVLGAARAVGARVAYAGCRLERPGQPAEVLAVPFDREGLRLANFVPTCAVVIARATLAEAGGFDESLPFLEDWELWLRLAQRHEFAFTPEVTSVYRVRPGTVGGEMAAERWQAMEQLFARHWDGITPSGLTARLSRLERDIADWRDRALAAEAEATRQRQENRFVRDLADAGLLPFVSRLHRLVLRLRRRRGADA